MSRRSVFALVIVVLALVARPALAESSLEKKKAAELFAEGKAAFAKTEYAVAGARFEAAAAILFHAATMLNAAEAWELAGDTERAVAACERVLADPSIEPRHVASAKARLARLAPPTPPSVDRKKENAAAPIKRQAPPSPIETPMTKRPSIAPPIASFIAFGASAATAGVGAFFAIDTMRTRDAFDREPTERAADEFDRARTLTNVSFAAAGVLAITGVVMWIVMAQRAPLDTYGRARFFGASF